jgi:hypothetical protein
MVKAFRWRQQWGNLLFHTERQKNPARIPKAKLCRGEVQTQGSREFKLFFLFAGAKFELGADSVVCRGQSVNVAQQDVPPGISPLRYRGW